MSEFSNGLTPAELERLALLAEEMGEVQQVIGKIIRHGYESVKPTATGAAALKTNRDNLELELADVRAVMKLMERASDIDHDRIKDYRKDKLRRIGKYLHHNVVSHD
jgi:NTP pyrophosphatase (non-canonical NTP hydrolase)